MIEKVKQFILENDLSFKEGTRNNNSVILSGFCCYLSLDRSDVREIIDCIKEVCPDHDDFEAEFDRVFEYAWCNDYGQYWNSDDAKKSYKY
jgi:hypothetical protein